MDDWKPGLAGVIAAHTTITRIDGLEGTLTLRGHPVDEVAALGFEAAAGLILGGAPLEGLGHARTRAARRQHGQTDLPSDPMDAVRALVASSSHDEPVEVIAEVGVAVARVAARQRGVPPGEADPAAGHAEDLLRLAGLDPRQAPALETYLATVMDHGLNASTFTARVIASTRADATSAVVGALGALKGPLHGGAPGPVLDMLDAIGTPEAAEAWVRAELDAGRRIMGMGHRVYRARDPRARVLARAASGLASERVRLAEQVEAVAERLLAERHPERPLRANVEFATAILLDAIGIDRALFTPWFAAGRVVGWMAHIAEERAVGRLIRPSARYVGPEPTPRPARPVP